MDELWNQLFALYLERGYGRLLEGHHVEIDSDSKMDYKYRDAGKLLWSQVDCVLQILSGLEKCRNGLMRVFENVKELYKAKEYPVGVFPDKDPRLFPISSRTVLSHASTSISLQISFLSACHFSFIVSTQRRVSSLLFVYSSPSLPLFNRPSLEKVPLAFLHLLLTLNPTSR